MAKLAKPKAPKAPKKPTTRSKTGNQACSDAASNWQLSLRGKAALSPDTYQTLAKCRAMASTQRRADAFGRTGKLSDQGAAALKGRIQKRFDSGLITEKSRRERLGMLLKQRGERGKVAAQGGKAAQLPGNVVSAYEAGFRGPNAKGKYAVLGGPMADTPDEALRMFESINQGARDFRANRRIERRAIQNIILGKSADEELKKLTKFGNFKVTTSEATGFARNFGNTVEASRKAVSKTGLYGVTRGGAELRDIRDVAAEVKLRGMATRNVPLEEALANRKKRIATMSLEDRAKASRIVQSLSKPNEPAKPAPAQPQAAERAVAAQARAQRFTPERNQRAAELRSQRANAPVLVQRGTEGSGGGEMIPPRAGYSLGGKLAPGRGTEERKAQAGFFRAVRSGDPKKIVSAGNKRAKVQKSKSKYRDTSFSVEDYQTKQVSVGRNPATATRVPIDLLQLDLRNKTRYRQRTGKLEYQAKPVPVGATFDANRTVGPDGKDIRGYVARLTGTDPKYKLKREFLNVPAGGTLTVSNRGIYESRGPSTSVFASDRYRNPAEKRFVLIGRKKVRELVDFQAERAVRLMERLRRS